MMLEAINSGSMEKQTINMIRHFNVTRTNENGIYNIGRLANTPIGIAAGASIYTHPGSLKRQPKNLYIYILYNVIT